MLDLALSVIKRGWYTFPCAPKKKTPIISVEKGGHGYKDATLDEAQVRAWWAEYPEANVPIATGASGLFIVDLDCHPDGTALTEEEVLAWMAEHNLPMTYAVRTGGKGFRVQLYYTGTGHKSKPFVKDGMKGDIRCSSGLVIAAGGDHKSGNKYAVIWDLPLEPVPDSALTLTEKVTVWDGPTTVDADKLEEWKTWLLEYADHNHLELTGFEKSEPNGWRLGIVCPWLDDHKSGKGTDSSTVLCILEGKVVFVCAHSCGGLGRNTKFFKEEMTKLHGAYLEEPGADTKIVLGSQLGKAAVLVPEVSAKGARPAYPMKSWAGTIVSEFAELCGKNNNVPLKLFAEAFRCVLGAVIGNQLTCPDVEGATPRTYTILLVPFGKGKGTAIGRAETFFESSAVTSIVFSGEKQKAALDAFLVEDPFHWPWSDKGVGAWVAGASSAPGMAALAHTERPRRKKKKEDEEEQPPLWGGDLPRVISVYEEAKNLFSSLSIENGVGHALTGAVCSLWDCNRFSGTATGSRAPASGRMLYSMLCGVTEKDWFDLLGKGDIVGGGLYSRLNLCGTLGEYVNVSKLRPPDFDPLRRVFFPRLRALADAPVSIAASPEADAVVDVWTQALPEGSERLNLHVWRTALLLAWLRGESVISGATAEDAVALGDYQLASHDYYRTEATDNAIAAIQQRMERVLKSRGPLGRSGLYKYTNGKRDGTLVWDKALQGLTGSRLVGQTEGKYFWAKADE